MENLLPKSMPPTVEASENVSSYQDTIDAKKTAVMFCGRTAGGYRDEQSEQSEQSEPVPEQEQPDPFSESVPEQKRPESEQKQQIIFAEARKLAGFVLAAAYVLRSGVFYVVWPGVSVKITGNAFHGGMISPSHHTAERFRHGKSFDTPIKMPGTFHRSPFVGA